MLRNDFMKIALMDISDRYINTTCSMALFRSAKAVTITVEPRLSGPMKTVPFLHNQLFWIIQQMLITDTLALKI